jgi:ATP-dependent RNA helicase DDX49/DBP8
MSTLFSKKRRRRTVQASLVVEPSLKEKPAALLAKPEQVVVSLSEQAAGGNDDDDGDGILHTTFGGLGLAEPLVETCRELGLRRPTPVQRTLIPFLLKHAHHHVLAVAATGSGKTAAFGLPILHRLAADPYSVYAVILTPTRELAQQIHQQVTALGSAYAVRSVLVVGGLDAVRQSCRLQQQRPHVVVATPGRLAELLRGPDPVSLERVRYLVLDEADRLLTARSGFTRDVAELLLHTTQRGSGRAASAAEQEPCQTLLFSATMTRSLETTEEIAAAGLGSLPLKKFVVQEGVVAARDGKADVSKKKATEDDVGEDGRGDRPRIPSGLKQEYVFMPSKVRDAYLLTVLRTLMKNGGRPAADSNKTAEQHSRNSNKRRRKEVDPVDEEAEASKARSAIVFVSTCERAALVSGILSHVGVQNVTLHSLLSQGRRLAALGAFKSQQVRVLVATDVASRGLDIPEVDLVVNAELPRSAVQYVHRVGRTARAGHRGRAVSLVSESDVKLVHAAEKFSGRSLEKCCEVTDDMAIKMLGPTTKAARLTKMKLMDIGFDELVQKFKARKARDKKERERIDKALRAMEKN